MVDFIECESLNISYNEMGLVTVTYTIVTDVDSFDIPNAITAGGQTFTGYVMTAFQQPIPRTDKSNSGGWYTINVTMIAVT